MTAHAMLTVDLNKNVSDDARKKFYAFLVSKKFTRLSLTTTFYAHYTAGVTEEIALEATKGYVQQAANYAGIANFEAAVQVGTIPSAVWKKS